MAFSISNLGTAKPFARKIMVHGASGAGKTHFIGTMLDVPELNKPLIVNLDAGAATLDGKDIASTDVRRLVELEEILWAFAQKKPEVASFNALVIDGLSEVYKRELQEITALAAKQPQKSGKERDKDEAQLKDYGTRNTRTMRIVRMIRDLPNMTVVATAWSRVLYPEIDGMPNKTLPPLAVLPDFSDSLMDPLMGAFDDVWCIKNDAANGRRLLITGDFENTRAKTRGVEFAKKLGTERDSKFFPVVVSPTFTTIVDAYRSAMNTKQGSK